MEVKQLFLILRRWVWVLALGLVIGLLAGYVASKVLKPVYEATTQLLVSNQLQGKNSDFAGLTNDQLTDAYIQLLSTDHLREATAEKIGVEIDPSQINVQRIAHTQVIQIRVDSHSPEQAAQIANTLVSILIEENAATRTEQFAAQETILSKQADQLKQQINTLQSEYEQASEVNYKSQLSKINEQLVAIQTELSSLQPDIAQLNRSLSVDSQAKLAEKQLRVDQLQASYKTYNEIRANMLVLGKPYQGSNNVDDPHLQEMQTVISLYQDTYVQLLSNLESTRLARLQQTPNAAQIQEALIPQKAIRPIPLLYTLLGGVIGLILAGIAVFFVSLLKESPTMPESAVPAREVAQGD